MVWEYALKALSTPTCEKSSLVAVMSVEELGVFQFAGVWHGPSCSCSTVTASTVIVNT